MPSVINHVRGRVLIYASKKKVDSEYEAEFLKEHRIAKSVSDELPRGVIVGSVDLYDCDGGEWYLRNPIRAKRLRKPNRKPQPVWFRPY